MAGRGPLAAVRPAHVGLAVVGGLLVVHTVEPIDDIDAYWHVALGREILTHRTLTPSGASWLTVPTGGWTTTQWASEAVMAGVVDLAGWRGLVLAGLVAALALVGLLTVVLLRTAHSAVALVVLALAGIGLAPHVQDRPQTVSLLALVWLSSVCSRAWSDRSHPAPSWLQVAVVTVVWAQFHGLWIVAPAAFLIAAVGVALDRARPGVTSTATAASTASTASTASAASAASAAASSAVSRSRPWLVLAAASLSGLLNPRGLTSFTAPLDFRGADAVLEEWQHSTLFEAGSLSAGLLLLVVVVAWLVGPRPLPRTELLWVAVWTAAAVTSYRNALAAVVPLALAAATSAERAWGGRLARAEGGLSARERRVLGWAVVGAAGVGVTASLASALAVDPLAGATARPLAQTLARSAGPVRVYNAYNTSGQLVAFGGGQVRLVVDGRFDLWGADGIRRALGPQTLAPGWEDTLRRFAPQAMVLDRRAPLTTLVTREGSWHVAQRSGDWVLLLPGRA